MCPLTRNVAVFLIICDRLKKFTGVETRHAKHKFSGPFLLSHAGLGGSVGCAVRLETRMSRVQPPLRSATFFRGS